MEEISFAKLLSAIGCVTIACVGGIASSDRWFISTAPAMKSPTVTYNASNFLWSDKFQTNDWMQHWQIRAAGSWGWQNATAIADSSGRFSKVLRVRYPAGSCSPTVSDKTKAPVGGTQFFADLGMQPRNSLRLSYYVRFSPNFDFIKGGKLPGLFGGAINPDKQIPDGTDSFSTRYMWRENGEGEVYAYLPTSKKHGTSIGRGNWQFQPGIWYLLEQEVRLNQPGQQDGRLRVWVNGKPVLDQNNLTFRNSDRLQIEGIFFSTFFGGSTPTWATPKDVYADFADFAVISE